MWSNLGEPLWFDFKYISHIFFISEDKFMVDDPLRLVFE